MGAGFQLGEYTVQPRRDCIERGDRTVHVKPKSMAVLERLAQSAGEVVTRQELFEAVWPGGEVTDDVLTQCIVELRKAFGDSARHPRYIETIPKVGFRLVPAVTPLEPVNGMAAGAQKYTSIADSAGPWSPAVRVVFVVVSTLLLGLVFFWYLGGSRSLPPAAEPGEEKSVAVLPFVDISEQQDQGWYAYGLTEELTNRLAQLEGLQVTSRTSSFHFKDSDEDLKSIARALGVRHVLEGSVRTDDSRVRITAQLIDSQSGFHSWSEQYDRPRTDIFEVHEEIAEAVATAMSIELGVGKLGTMPGSTDSVEAYELLMLSKRYQWENTRESIVQAIDLVKRAIQIDPGYARAWWRLAGLYLNAREIYFNSNETDWVLLSEQALEHARSLEPDLPGVKYLRATLLGSTWQWAEMEQIMDRGANLELSSNHDLLLAWVAFLKRVGRIQESIPYLERMRRLNPYSNATARALSWAYVVQGRTDEGLAEAERAFQLDGFNSWAVENGLLIALALQDRDLLRTWLRRAEQHLPESRPLIEAMWETLDDREAALAWLRVAFQRNADHDYFIVPWAVWHGDQELALDAMERTPVPAAFWGIGMREVRRHPRFGEVVRQVGLEEYYREYGWNDFCRPLTIDDFRCD